MKKIIILCTVLGLMVLNSGCTVRSAVDIQRPELKSKRKTKKINWSTREQMENLIGNPPGVFMVLFVDPEEQQSMKSIELVSRIGKADEISLLNLREQWVLSIFQQMELESAPMLLILDPQNDDGSKDMIGYSAIKTYLTGMRQK